METIREIQNNEETKKNKLLSAAGSFLSVAGLMAILMAFSLKPLDPPITIIEMELAYGIPDAGGDGGESGLPEQTGATSSNDDPNDLTQDIEDAPTGSTNPNPSPNPTRTEGPPVVRLPGYSTGQGGDDTPGEGGHGDGKTRGPQGGDGTAIIGKVSGLGNRSVKVKPEGHSKCEFSGFIKVKIQVSPEGRVVKAEYQAAGSTIANTLCKNDAIAQAKQWSFAPDPTATGVVEGVITIEFK